jgi:hypothetical protein
MAVHCAQLHNGLKPMCLFTLHEFIQNSSFRYKKIDVIVCCINGHNVRVFGCGDKTLIYTQMQYVVFLVKTELNYTVLINIR